MKNQSSSQGSLFGFRPPRWLAFPGNLYSRDSGQLSPESTPVASPHFSRKAAHIFSSAGLFVLLFLWVGICQLLAQSQETFTTPGTINWSPPAGTYQVQIECWGGGAPGGSNLYGGNGGNYTRSIPLLIGAFTNATMTITVGGQSQESRVTGAPFPIYASGGSNGGSSPVADPFTFLIEVNFAGGRGGSPSVFPNVCSGVRTGGSGGGSAYTNANGGAGQTSSGCSIAQGGNGYGKGGNNQTNTAGQNGTAPGGGGGSSIGGSLTTTGAGAPGQVRITYWCVVNEVGVIGNPHTVVNPQELVPDLVSSVQPAVVMSGTPPYGWEEQLNGSSVWNDIPGATGSSYSIPNINQTRTYRRYTEVCNLGRSYTNEVVIKVMAPNGNISGKVRSTNGVGVEGIEVQAKKQTGLPGSPKEFVYSTTTGPDGAYSIPVYYGDPNEGSNNGTVSTDFVIRPIKLNHDFAPDSLIRSVSTTNFNRENVDFTDNTAFSITGKVYQQCVGCLDQNDQPVTVSSNLDGVTILRKGNFVMKTAYLNPPGLYGQWASTVTDQGIYSFKPTLEGHHFLPDSLIVNVLNNVAGIDFEDTTHYTISGRFGDGCNNYIGIAELEFSDILLDKDGNERPSEFRKRIFTNDDGTYFVRLPARKYRVSVIGFTLASSSEPIEETDLLAFFNNAPLPSALSADSLLTDISSGNQQLNLRYQRPPSILLIGFDNSLCDNGSPLPYLTLRQSDKKIIQVKVFQGSVGLGCPLSDDTVRIVTNLAGDDQNESFFMLPVGGVAKDSLKVGSPNILGNFRKVFNVDYTDSYGRKATQVKPEIVVLGVKSDNASSFATTSPQIPLIVLHDPPGDQSYSYWETNKTIERAMRWSAASGNNVEGWLNIKVGAQFEAGLGVTTETQIWGSINSSVAVNSRTNNAEESIVSTTTTQNISTSADEDVTGDGGDLFIGAAMNLLYTRSTQVMLDENCQLVAPKRLMIAQNGFATQYVYTASAIRDNVIPTLQNFVNNPGNSELETRNYQNQIKVWEQVLANNELNKGRSALDKNISFFGSSGPISNSTTTTATKTNTIEFDMEIDAGLALELGFEIAGSGLSGGVNVHMKTEMGNSTTNTTTNSTTIGYTLDDNDALDNFSVNVRKDPVYNTPVFQTVAGQSSCPPESNTQPRDEIQLTVQNPVLTDVPASSDAIFEMKLGNLSIDPNPRTYNLSFEQASNPFGATISIGGSTVDGNPIPYTIDPGDEVSVTVNVKRNPANSAFTYEGLKFTLSDACSGDVQKSALLSASFVVNCSPITMSLPEAGWLCNQSSNDVIKVVLKDYVLANLTQVQLQYAKVGSNNWRTGFTKLASELSTSVNGSTINWNVSSLVDGEYYLRIKLVCSGGITYTQRVAGTIDRKSPLVLGTPQPTDGIFSIGDDISFTFDENIRTSDLNNSKVELRLFSNNQLIPSAVSGSGARLVITPMQSLQDFAGERIRVTMKNVFDLNGNLMAGTDTLLFNVEGFEPSTGNKALQVAVNQPSVIENANDTLLFVFTLPVNTTDNVQVNFTIGGDATFGDDYDVSFSGNNSLNSFDGVAGRIFIPKYKNSVTLRIHPKADGIVETNENILIGLTEGGDYEIGANYSATSILIDNSIAPPTISGATQFCPGTTTVLTASHPQAGNAGYAFLWSNGATTQSVSVNQPGIYTVTITETATGLSGSSADFTLTAFTQPNTQAGADFSLSQNSGNVTLGGSPSGGSWSGTGVSGNLFNSNQALGVYPLVYCYTSAEGCTKCDTVLVTITSAPLPPAADPVFTPGAGTFANPVAVTLATTTVGAKIYYTTTGNLPVVGTSFTLLYTAPVQVNQTTTIKAMAVLTGSPNSAVVSGLFTISNPNVVATPVISPGTGTYVGSKLVTISTATSGAEIYYTTTGNNPLIGAGYTKLYTGPFWVLASTTVRAMGVKTGLTNSAIATSYLTITSGTSAAPTMLTIAPEPGQFTTTQTVELTYEDPMSTLYYTLDGTEPNPDSANTFVYTGPFELSSSAMVVAIAMKNGEVQGLLDPSVYQIGTVTANAGIRNQQTLKVYPNPSADGVFHLSMPEGSGDKVLFDVLGLDGRVLQSGHLNRMDTRIDLQALPSGSYTLRIQRGTRPETHRLIRL